MLKIYTSTFNFSGKNRLDITYKAKTPFSPTKELVYGYKYHGITEDQYIQEYYKMMRESWKRNSKTWNELLNKEEVVLVCYCPKDTFCHRYILKDMLVAAGGKYCGEITNK